MTAAGTFALDTNTYLTSLPSTVVQTNQGNTYGAYAQNFGSTTMTLPSSVTQGGYTTTFPAATGTLAIGGGCSAGQYMYGNNLTTACSQVAYSQLTGTPTLGNWAALNYPTWASGTPFVKMTGAGTFSLDTNIYLTSSAIASTTNLLSGDGSGNAVSSGIAASNVPLLNAANTFTATNTFNNATYSALFTGGNVGIGTTSPGAKLNVYDVDANLYNKTGMDVNVAYGNPGGGKTTTALSIGVPNLGTNTNSLTSYGLYIDDIYSYYGLNSPTDNANFGLYVKGGANNYIQGNVSIGDTTATSMFNVGTANQFQVTSTGVSSAGAGSTDLNGSGVPEAHCLADGSGGGVCGTSTPAFSAITSATNTTASMVVGTGGSLGVSGSGTISANVLAGNGVTNTSIASLGTGSLVPGSCINGGASAVTGTTASSVVTASLSATAAVMLAAPAQGIVVTALLSTDTHVPSFYVCDTTLTSWTYTGYSVAMQVH
jgi:hypothetical protein